MNHRDRVYAAIEHMEPDRVPLDLGSWVTGIHRIAYDRLKRYLGVKTKTSIIDMVQQLALMEEPILKRLDIDTRHVYPGVFGGAVKEFPDGSYLDAWGVKRVPAGYYYDMPANGHPLKGLSSGEIDEYPWPDPSEEADKVIGKLEKETKHLHEKTDYSVVLDTVAFFFEMSWYMRSFEGFFVDLKRRPEMACRIMDKIVDFQVGFHGEVLDAVGDYVDVATMGDDLAMQDGPLMSKETYRRCVKPRQKRIVDLFKRKAGGAKIFYHGCGSARDHYHDLAEIGVDIVNPVQVSARDMGDTEELKAEYGDELCFWGAVDTQRVLPFGSPRDVEEEVKRRIRDLAPGGGYVLCAVHNIQPDVPPENIVMMYEAAKKYGTYPVTLPRLKRVGFSRSAKAFRI